MLPPTLSCCRTSSSQGCHHCITYLFSMALGLVIVSHHHQGCCTSLSTASQPASLCLWRCNQIHRSSLVCCVCDHETQRACLYRQATCGSKIFSGWLDSPPNLHTWASTDNVHPAFDLLACHCRPCTFFLCQETKKKVKWKWTMSVSIQCLQLAFLSLNSTCRELWKTWTYQYPDYTIKSDHEIANCVVLIVVIIPVPDMNKFTTRISNISIHHT